MGVTFWKGKFLSACLQDYLENANPDIFIEQDAVELAKLVYDLFILLLIAVVHNLSIMIYLYI